MKIPVLLFSFFILVLGVSYTSKMNRVLHLRIQAPHLEKKIREEKAKKAQYELEWLLHTSPEKLLQLKEKPQYGYLDFPKKEQIVFVQQSARQGEP